MGTFTHPGMKRLFALKEKNGLGRFALSALPALPQCERCSLLFTPSLHAVSWEHSKTSRNTADNGSFYGGGNNAAPDFEM